MCDADPLRQPQHLPRVDRVGIGQLVPIRLEDFHVVASVPEMLLRNGAQRVADLHDMRLVDTWWKRGGSCHLDISNDIGLPCGNCLDRGPELVFSASVTTVPLK
jgi:hypothetical protein